MEARDLATVLPLLVLGVTAVAVMLQSAFYGRHEGIFMTAFAGIALSFISLFTVRPPAGGNVLTLLVMDRYALFFMGLLQAAGLAAVLFSYDYLQRRSGRIERTGEYYLLLILALFGSCILVSAGHFASFFLGLEILGVSLYGLIAYGREKAGAEAGLKYLVLAAVSSSFLLFGMSLVYAELGTMDFPQMAARISLPGGTRLNALAGIALIIVGLGFKLALVPFHLWIPDVYEGAPAPVAGFVATVSKGAVFALMLRYFLTLDVLGDRALFTAFTAIAAVSMFAGNLLALFQDNVKRLLAYSSIAHFGYLLVAFLAAGRLRMTAAAFYLAAYFITTLGAFGVVATLSGEDRDADRLSDYEGLSSRRPWLAGIFTAILLSLAGIPVTAGFIGKFYVAAAGVGSSLWFLVIVLALNSAIGLFYYLRVLVVLYRPPAGGIAAPPRTGLASQVALAILVLLLIGLGVYPGPLTEIAGVLTAGP